ncbi:hypothetical protein [Rhodococcus jostii]|uniref:Uncharacterized protein n=1 Tax=Rhodococcus jostii TaxID=132919 RepID=A0ABU4CTT8_RHOJO|nr:hypothetical protein [Rhodococcus jostii]MDV6286981.1 hypothetical protein [Rhodococcus jostii]
MGYFSNADELSTELIASLELFLASEDGHRAAELAVTGFDLGDGLPDEPLVAITTSNPSTTTTLILGSNARVEANNEEERAQVRLNADADSLHDLLLENYDAGQIARAVEEHRLSVSGSPWSLDALIVLAGAYAGFYRRSLEERGRQALLETPAPAPSGIWEVPVPRPEDFMGVVVPARRQFAQRMSR